LLDHQVSAAAIVPGAVFTVLGLVCMRIISGFVLQHWLESYSRTYGAIGIVMEMFFWLIISSTILIRAVACTGAPAWRATRPGLAVRGP
jgi:uncharacterized BrkB/YihY/UPF0761 family membrane protein